VAGPSPASHICFLEPPLESGNAHATVNSALHDIQQEQQFQSCFPPNPLSKAHCCTGNPKSTSERAFSRSCTLEVSPASPRVAILNQLPARLQSLSISRSFRHSSFNPTLADLQQRPLLLHPKASLPRARSLDHPTPPELTPNAPRDGRASQRVVNVLSPNRPLLVIPQAHGSHTPGELRDVCGRYRPSHFNPFKIP